MQVVDVEGGTSDLIEYRLPVEQKDALIQALRSGAYLQGNSCLRNTHDEYCCLGVQANLLDPKGWNTPAISPLYSWKAGEYRSLLGGPESAEQYLPDEYMHPAAQQALARMNDDGNTFREIADWIQEHL